MATESTSLTSPSYSNTTTFREVFSKLSSDIKGAHRCVRDAARVCADIDHSALKASILFSCVEEQTKLLCHIWSYAFTIDEALYTGFKSVAQIGSTLKFLDIDDPDTVRGVRFLHTLTTQIMENVNR